MANREFNSLASFATFLEARAAEMPERLFAAADVSSKVIKGSVQMVFGDKGKLLGLKDTTIELRGGTDDPLFIDGTLLRNSIEAKAESLGPEASLAGVGSAQRLLLKHEHGYVTAAESMIPGKVVPPRPAFARGVMDALPKVKEIVQALLNPDGGVIRGAGLSLGTGVGAPMSPISESASERITF